MNTSLSRFSVDKNAENYMADQSNDFSKFIIFPNRTSGEFRIKDLSQIETWKLNVYDINNRLVYDKLVDKNCFE